jgi:hypothetical protein
MSAYTIAPIGLGLWGSKDRGSLTNIREESRQFGSDSLTMKQGHSRSEAFTAENIVQRASRRLSSYGDSVTAAAVRTAYLGILYLVGEQSATPQIGADGEGGLSIEWLVDGRALIFESDADGSGLLWVLESDGNISLRGDVNLSWVENDMTLQEARRVLHDMSLNVHNRVGGTALGAS